MRAAKYLIPLAALLLVVTATRADAGNPPVTKLKIGDAVDVVGTRIACFAVTSSGKAGIACVLWKGSKPIVGSYGAGLAVDGTAVVNRIKSDGSAQTVIKKRVTSSARSVYKMKVGDGFGIPAPGGNALGCRVLNITSTSLAPIYRGIKVSCWIATATNPLPNRYGVSISDKFAGVFKFTAKGEVSTWGVFKRQPAG